MTRPDLTAIAARAEAATPGPWTLQPRGDDKGMMGWNVDGPPEGVRGEFALRSDAAFICAARDDVPALLQYIVYLEEQQGDDLKPLYIEPPKWASEVKVIFDTSGFKPLPPRFIDLEDSYIEPPDYPTEIKMSIDMSGFSPLPPLDYED